jgi:hypothetical protein
MIRFAAPGEDHNAGSFAQTGTGVSLAVTAGCALALLVASITASMPI